MARRLGRYEVVVELARGGMGIVSLARAQGHAGFDKLAILKELKPALALEPELQTMFLDEARLAARMNHRNIVQTYEVGAESSRYFMALEYLDGGSLRSLLKRHPGGRLPPALAVRIVCEALEGLHYAHELTSLEGTALGVIHRDVSPQNIFLTVDGQVKVIDFGVAKTRDREQQTQLGVLKGCIPYMSPEHATGEAIDRRADVFSMGTVLCEALTGERLWHGLGEATILRRLLDHQIPRIRDATVPEGLRAICEKAMAPAASDRFASAEEMRFALEKVARELEGDGSLASLAALVIATFAEDRAGIAAKLRSCRSAESHPGSPAAGADDDGSPTKVERSGVSASVLIIEGSRERLGHRLPKTLAGAAAIACVAAIVTTLLRHEPRPVRPAAPAATMVERRPEVAPLPPAEIVELTIRTTPAEATIYIDDVPVGHAIHHASYGRSAERRRVRVSAPGYRDATEDVTLASSTSLSIALERPPLPATPPRQPKARPVAAAPTATVVAVAVAPPVASTRSSQKLDSRNPYRE